MEDEYSYADIALEDLQASRELLKVRMYNHATRLCQQYVEKMFKDVIFRLGKDERDMLSLSSHNINKLSKRVAALLETEFSKDDMGLFRTLTDCYFDTNYPGENYVRISKEEARDIYSSTLVFAGKIQLLFKGHILDASTLYAAHRKFIKSLSSVDRSNSNDTLVQNKTEPPKQKPSSTDTPVR